MFDRSKQIDTIAHSASARCADTGPTMNPFRDHWALDPQLSFLNHGSFGATPTVVLENQREYQQRLEADPIEFLAPERSLEPKLDHVRECLARLVHADPADLAWVRNATDGVNAVVRSIPLSRDDEIVVTNHGYNACTNAVHYAARSSGAKVVVAKVPFPISGPDEVIAAIQRVISSRTRLVLVDHVTSPSGLVFPLREIIDVAHASGARVLVDGAHGPGMLPLDLSQLGADYYTANHHKWLCAPKVSGFLWVRREWQREVRPTVISHAANRDRSDRSRFLCEFDWPGTFDPSPLLALPRAIEFLQSLHEGGIDELMRRNRRHAIQCRDLLCDALGIYAPAPDSMLGSLVAVPLPPRGSAAGTSEQDPLQRELRETHGFELPVFTSSDLDVRVLRIAFQAYNDVAQVERLAGVLRDELKMSSNKINNGLRALP